MAKKVSATDEARSKGGKVKTASARKTKAAKKSATTHKLEWRGVAARVRHTPN